jgi:hypothetical protein
VILTHAEGRTADVLGADVGNGPFQRYRFEAGADGLYSSAGQGRWSLLESDPTTPGSDEQLDVPARRIH